MRLFLRVAGVLLSFAFIASADESARIYSLQFHPQSNIPIDLKSPSMNQSWPNNRYPDDIGKPDGFVFTQPKLWGDRLEYWSDEPVAQFFALFGIPEDGIQGKRVQIEIIDAQNKVLTQTLQAASDNKISFRLDITNLPVGKYSASAKLLSAQGEAPLQTVQFTFQKTNKKHTVTTIPESGIPIRVEKHAALQNGRWPVRCGIPLPYGAITDISQLALHEDGKPIEYELRPRAQWWIDGAIKWVHLYFQAKYTNGQPAEYSLRKIKAPPKPGEPHLFVKEDADSILVNTGYVRFVINRKKYSGIEQAWFDPTGSMKFDLTKPVINKSDLSGPYLRDEKDDLYTAQNDGDVEVSVEEKGATRATILARGWYTKPGGEKLCKFTVRIHAYANQPMLRGEQQMFITYDAHKKQVADLGFRLPVSGTQATFGVDGKSLTSTLPAAPQSTFLHQDRWDHFRVVTPDKTQEGKQSDGWAQLSGGGSTLSVALRNIWQKYPKELETSRDGLTLHFWPRHGADTFTPAEELRVDNIYKFLCFHEGKLMNLKTPPEYIAAFDEHWKKLDQIIEGGPWWRESEHDGTKSGNAQGRVISNEFAVLFGDAKSTAPVPGDAATFSKLFQYDPTAAATPEWNTSTDAIMPMSAADPKYFPEMEETVLEGFLSWTRSVERYHDYGMWNYADTQTIHVVGENRPGLHRTWQGSHYHNVGMNWVQYYRTGDPRELRWARDNTDHYINVKTVSYVDSKNPVPQQDHELGSMQHIGWKTHWGSSSQGEAWGQFGGVTGHHIDPDAYLWCWYLTGNERAWEAYQTWANAYEAQMPGQYIGWAREVINTLAYGLSCYDALHRPTFLPGLYTTARSLRTLSPLENQQPGPMWHPWWLIRVYDQTRDPEYAEWIVKVLPRSAARQLYLAVGTGREKL